MPDMLSFFELRGAGDGEGRRLAKQRTIKYSRRKFACIAKKLCIGYCGKRSSDAENETCSTEEKNAPPCLPTHDGRLCSASDMQTSSFSRLIRLGKHQRCSCCRSLTVS
eukprot:760765-Hanusia_phi.AAC.5